MHHILILFMATMSFVSSANTQWVFNEIGNGTKPSIYIDGSDDIHLTSLIESTSEGVLTYYHISGSQVSQEVVNEQYFYGPIDIITNDQGQPVIAFHHHNVGEGDFKGELALATKTDQGNWTIDVASNQGHDGWDGTLGIDAGGVVHTISNDPSNGTEYGRFDNGIWTIETLDGGNSAYQYGTDIEIDASDIPHVAYYKSDISTLRYATRAGGSWVSENIDSNAVFPSMILTESGPMIAYYKVDQDDDDNWAMEGQIMTATRSGGSWDYAVLADITEVQTGAFRGARAIVDIQQADDGTIHVAFSNNKIVQYGTLSNGSWDLNTILNSDEQPYATIGEQVSLALQSDGTAHVATFRRTDGNNGAVIYGTNSTAALLPDLICPLDTTISCEVLITPENTGMPDSTSEFSRFEFVDTMLQECPGDIIIERSWIGFVDDTPVDTCVQMITVVLTPLDSFSITDTLTVGDVCIDQLDDVIQTDLALPCNVGIDSISVDEVERTCDRIVLSAFWTFSNECLDTSFTRDQTIIISDRVAAKLDDAVVVSDTGSTSGSITLISNCPFDSYTYNWSNGSTDSVLTNLAGGSYEVTITNQEGCMDTIAYTVAGVSLDTMMMDTMMMDTMMMDTMMMDTMMMDTMMMDTMMMDTMMMDTMMMDTMMMDTMMMDTMMMDTMMMDTMMMDTMMMDTMMMDTMMMDTMMMDTVIKTSLSISISSRSGAPMEVDSIYFMREDSTFVILPQDSSGAYLPDSTLSEIAGVCIENAGRAIDSLSVIDLVRGQSIILQSLDGCAEDRVALDVSDDGNTSGFDLVLMRSVILERRSEYPSGLIWKFVNASGSAIDHTAVTPGSCIILSDEDRIRGSINVMGIKLGDLRCADQ